MISKISKLKNFGIFHDFSWNAGLPEFKKFNLIYGSNRSGKTTFSRIFVSCEKKHTYNKDKFNQYPANFDKNGNLASEGEFEIITSDNAIIKNTEVGMNVLSIKVFNQDFVEDNIFFDPSKSCNPIIYVSEENIEKKKKLEFLNDQIKPLSVKYQEFKIVREGLQKIEDNFRISLAQTVTQLLTDKTKKDRYYSYDKSKVREKIEGIGIDNFGDKGLSDVDSKKYEAISKSEAGKNQNLFLNYQFSFFIEGEIVDTFSNVYKKIENLLDKKVVSQTLDRLKNDPKLNSWVKQGFDLYKVADEKERCLFCQKPLDNDFLLTLSKHFSKEYEELENSILSLKRDILKLKKEAVTVNNNELNHGLREKYAEKASELNECIERINTWIDEALEKIEEKFSNPLMHVASPQAPDDFLTAYNSVIAGLNKIIDEHNEIAKNHTNEVSIAREKLELHLIATALNEQDYKKMVTDVKEALKNEKDALEATNSNNSNIIELEKQTSNIGNAIIDINKHLKEFFGKEEIQLKLDDSKEGYIIIRDGQPAKNLSEGEKTAIAFSYFVAKVGEGNFDKSKGIIFIDDPISSFDSNFIYHCFSIIKNYFGEVGQLFVSTHNFQFFNLLKDWFIKKNRNIDEENKIRIIEGKTKREPSCEFYMIKSSVNLNPRNSSIVILDSTLRDYKSEYSFIFSLLNDFNNKKEDPTFEEIYNIANLGRRFFEIFADFKIPTNKKDQKEKIDIIVQEINDKKLSDDDKISKVACDKVFWLINGFSHNSDPTSTIEHKDKSESKDAIRILLNIVKESDPTHFEILKKN